MTTVDVEVWSTGDGYLTVDTDAWIADRATRDDKLSEHLADAMERDGQFHPNESYIVDWLREMFGVDGVSGPNGEGDPMSVCLMNVDNLLSEEIGYILAETDDGPLMVVNGTDDGFYKAAPEVYRVDAWSIESCLDYTYADASCPLGHRWHTDDACHLVGDDGSRPCGCRITDLARLGDEGDLSTGFIACPVCAAPLTFTC